MRSGCRASMPALRGGAGAGDICSVAVQAGTFCSARTQRGKEEPQRAALDTSPHRTNEAFTFKLWTLILSSKTKLFPRCFSNRFLHLIFHLVWLAEF